MPNLNHQPTCNFSLYIDPQITIVSVGESVHLKCPQNSTQIKWWKITSEGSFALDDSIGGNIDYEATDANETEMLILCTSLADGKEFILGIGKVIISNDASQPTSLITDEPHLDVASWTLGNEVPFNYHPSANQILNTTTTPWFKDIIVIIRNLCHYYFLFWNMS